MTEYDFEIMLHRKKNIKLLQSKFLNRYFLRYYIIRAKCCDLIKLHSMLNGRGTEQIPTDFPSTGARQQKARTKTSCFHEPHVREIQGIGAEAGCVAVEEWECDFLDWPDSLPSLPSFL